MELLIPSFRSLYEINIFLIQMHRKGIRNEHFLVRIEVKNLGNQFLCFFYNEIYRLEIKK